MDQNPFESSAIFGGEQTPPPAKKNGYAIASLVLGIVSLVSTCCCSCILPVTAILSIVFAAISKKNEPMSGMAKGGMICSIIALALLAISVIALLLNPAYVTEFERAFREGFEAGYSSTLPY